MTTTPPTESSTAQLKESSRQTARTVRRRAFDAAGTDVGDLLADQFMIFADDLRLPLAGIVVAGYWPMGSEIDCRPLLRRLQNIGSVCALPCVVEQNSPLVFRRWQPEMTLIDGNHGTSMPPMDAGVVIPEIVLTPLLAFDRGSFRLGYGGGYYDRSLSALRASGKVTAIGLGFAAQEIENVPRDKFDERLDRVITEGGS